MLITLYEEDNSAKFSSKFTTPLHLPKNATIQLLKAYIPRDHQVVIDNTNNEIALLLHTQDNNAIQHINITNGTYGLQALATEIKRAVRQDINVIEANNSGQLRGVEFDVLVDIDNNNHGAGAITLHIELLRHQLDFYYRLDFTDAGNLISDEAQGHFESAMDSAGTFTLVKSNGSLRPSVKQDGGGTVINKWDNHAVIIRDLKRNAFSATTVNDMTNDNVMRIAYPKDHTLIAFDINDLQTNGNSFWIGIRKQSQAIDTTGVANNQLDQVVNITGLESCMVFYGTTANGKTAGTCEFYENIAGTFTQMGRFVGGRTTPLIDGDKLLMLIPANNDGATNDPIQYKLFKPATSARFSPRIANAHRFIPAQGDNYELCFGWYNQATTGAFRDLRVGMDAGYNSANNVEGTGIFDEFGKYAKVFINGAGATANNGKDLKTTLGFTDDDYEDDKTAHGHLPAVIDQANQNDMITNDQKQPYLNMNITNLPVVSYTCSDTNASNVGQHNTQHNFSKCVASIPRYNQDGSYDNGAIMYDDNTQTIQLNNADECELSSLDVRLQNCDGSYPTDLRTPSSFVLKVSGDNIN